jgi:hypothetical protein
MSITDQVAHALDRLSDAELKQVADFVAFLRFRERIARMPMLDKAQLASFYDEFAEEDHKLAFGVYRQHHYDDRILHV